MTDPTSLIGELVFDTGPLSHFAEAGWLSVLRSVAGDTPVVIPEVVAGELRRGAGSHQHLQLVLNAPWIQHRVLDSPEEISAYGHFASLLVSGNRNAGEAAVLAYASIHRGTAVIDDRVDRRAAHAAGVSCRGTLALLCDAIRAGLLTLPLVEQLADHLLETHYRLPFPSGGFAEWAAKNDLF
ncbi:hypothetical protein ACFQ3B_10455 [Stackebrandtia endophytica]|nr:hypothetical protein [Stackebrandtia endophytica]